VWETSFEQRENESREPGLPVGAIRVRAIRGGWGGGSKHYVRGKVRKCLGPYNHRKEAIALLAGGGKYASMVSTLEIYSQLQRRKGDRRCERGNQKGETVHISSKGKV